MPKSLKCALVLPFYKPGRSEKVDLLKQIMLHVVYKKERAAKPESQAIWTTHEED